jgi:hypothetical protein
MQIPKFTPMDALFMKLSRNSCLQIYIIAFLFLLHLPNSVNAQVVMTYNSNGDFTVPPNVSSIIVQAWGGGGGASSTTFASRPGAGGGAYASSVIQVIPGQTYNVTVGTAGTTATPTGNAGGNSVFSLEATNFVLAAGGSGGGEVTPGAGGTISASIGDNRFEGGDGGLRFFPAGAVANNGGGGGGGSAFSNASGNNGENGTATAGGAGGTGTGAGGSGGGTSPVNGQAGIAPGGGGGGRSFNAGALSGAGAAGRIVISYCPDFEAEISGLTDISFGCSTTLTASGGESYLWSPDGQTTASINVSPITNTVYTVTATDINGCIATAQTTVNVSGAIEIGDICACTDGNGNVTFTIKLNNWPTCGGPFTVGVNYTRSDLSNGILSAGGVASDLSGMTSIIFGPVSDAASTGNLSLSSVVNDLNQNQSINTGQVAYAISGGLNIICPATVNVNTEPNLCFGLVPDLSDEIDISGGCGAYNITQSLIPGTAFGAACNDEEEITVMVSDPGCSIPASCVVKLVLIDNQQPAVSSVQQTSTVPCPDNSDTAPATLPVVTDNCGFTLDTPTPVISTKPDCNGIRTYTYTYDDGCGNSIDWVYTYNIQYSWALVAPSDESADVDCLDEATIPDAPEDIMDACGRTVSPVLIGSDDNPDPLTCNGTRVWTYRYTACDGTTTADWTFTYNINYQAGLTPPANEGSPVNCISDAVDPGPPSDITDVCGRPVSASLLGFTDSPDPLTCIGTRIWTYRYTACDGTTTADWTYTYTINPSPVVLSCPEDITVSANMSQSAINAALNNWLNSASVSGGCNATIMNSGGSAPDRCTGGTLIVVFTVTSDCESASSCTQTFTVPASTLSANIGGVSSICVGGTLFLNGNPTGGAPGYTHFWELLPSSTGSGNFSNTAMQSPGLTVTSPGIFNIQYTVTDANGCTFVAQASFIVPVECDFEFRIDDPCICNNDADVNADNGTFMELVTVTGPNGAALPFGQNWTIQSVFGGYSASPLNEENIPGPQGALLTAGQPLAYCNLPGGCTVYNSASGTMLMAPFGSYYLAFAHVDHEGYTMVVEGPGAFGDLSNVTLSSKNVCFYPQLSIIASTVACDTDGPLPLQGLPAAVTAASSPFFSGNAAFTGGQPPYSYTIQNGLTDNGDGTASFNPAVAGAGTHIISFSFEGNPAPNSSSPGCWSAVEFAIEVKASLTLSGLVVNEGCEGVSNGAINLTVTPSAAVDMDLYNYIWSNGAVSQNIDNLTTGNYSVTVTHPDACTQTASFFVNAKPNPDPVLIVSGNSQYSIAQCQSTGLIIFQGTVIACDIEAGTNLSLVADRLTISGVAGLSANPTYVDTENGFAYFEFTGSVAPGSYLAFVTYDDGATIVTVDVLLQVIQSPDSQNPVITDCPSGLSIDVDEDLCTAEVTLSAPLFTDNCPADEITVSFGVINPDNTYSGPHAAAVSYNFSVGSSLVIWTVTDLAENFSTCIQNVSVTDNIFPDVICPAIDPATKNNTNGSCGYITDDDEFDAVATDNCGFTLTHNYGAWGNPNSLAGAEFPVGSTTVIWTARDESGNEMSCMILIDVMDANAPSFVNCPENITFTIGADADCQNGVIWNIPIAQDNCHGVTVTQTSGPVLGAQLIPGMYNIVYTAADATNLTSACSFFINVVDDSTPLLVCPPSFTIGTGAGDCFWTSGVGELNPLLAVDNCPNQVLTYSISGNPIVNGTGNLPATTFNPGLSTVTYTLTDENNNAVTCSFEINVIDDDAPVLPCANVVFGNLVGPFGNTTDFCALNTNVTLIGVTDNCDADLTVFALVSNPDQTLNVLPFPLLAGNSYQSGLYDFQVGITTLTFYATDDAGNASSCIYQIQVVDTETPEIMCPSDSPFLRSNTNGLCGYIVAGTEFDATATDNCPDHTLSHNYYSWANPTSLAGATFPVGTTNVTWTVTDARGNATNCPITVTVTDIQPPIANCQPQIDAVLDNDGFFQILTTMMELGSSDNCAITSYAVSRDGLSFGPSFYVNCTDIIPNVSNVVNGVMRVTDASGNSATCNTVINVFDFTRPTVICQNLTVYLDDDGEATIMVADIDAGSYDNCTIVSRALSNTDFDCDNIGNNNVTLTVTDAAGNTGICVSTVTVRDTIRPVFTCPSPMNVAGCAGVIPDLTEGLSASDNCSDNILITQNPVAGSLFGPNPGDMIFVTVSATDENGNTGSCQVTLTIIDSEMPYFVNCPQQQLVYANNPDQCSATVNWSIPVAMDNCTQVMAPQHIVQTMGLPPGSAFAVGGPYTIEYTATDNDNNSAVCQWTFIVVDTQQPEILVGKPQNITVECDDIPLPLVLNPNDVEDNCDPEPAIAFNQQSTQDADAAVCEHYNYMLTNVWTVTDASGNTQSWNQIVTVMDTKAPVLTLPLDMTVECNGEYVVKSFTCNPGDNEYSPDPAFAEFGVATATDNCAPSDFICIEFTETFTPGDCGYTGVITRTWTATDPCGNTSSGVQRITIVDTTPPAFTCMDITVNLNASGTVTVSAVDVIVGGLAGITEDCSDPEDLTFQMSQSTFTCTDLGENEIMLVVTDACGNSAACLATVTVRDITAPVITCPGPVTVNLNPGECRAFISQRASTTDNCSAVITYSPDITKAFEIGTTLITATATDAAGNSASCTFTVTVIEYIPVVHSMACNNLINLSLDGDCKAVINADMILEGDNYRCYEKYCITITSLSGVPHANLFDLNDVGKTFKVSITDCLGGGNSCWGMVNIEQKLIPEIKCPDNVTILCSEDKDARNNQGKLLTGEVSLMSCVPGYTVGYSDVETQFGLCNTPSARYTRTFTVYYNQTNKVSCVQNIDVLPFNLNQLAWPADRVLNCGAVAANSALTHPSNTGYPTIGGKIVDDVSSACNLSHTYEDKQLWLCGNSFEILRKWTIRNRCLPVGPGNPAEYIQIIEVIDQQAPTVICPQDITLNTSPWTCTATSLLPVPASITDNCGVVSFKAVLYGKGKLIVSGTPAAGNLRVMAEGLEKGVSVVRYEFRDECGNLRACNFNVTVLDKVAPTAISKQDIVISLIQDTDLDGNENGHAKLFAESVDNGSHDNCSPVRLEVRRPAGPSCGNIGNNNYNNNRTYKSGSGSGDYPDDTDGGRFVKFCCEDANAIVVDANGDGVINELDRGYHEVILRVWDDGNMNGVIGDAGDNWSETWAFVKVEMKAPPVILCPSDVTVHCAADFTTSTVNINVAGINFGLTGQPQVFGTCNPAVVTFRDVFTVNQCNIGFITRTFTINANNATRTCTQKITLAPGINEPVWTVTPPSDIAVEVSCDGPTEAQIKSFGPAWVAGVCDVIGLSHKIREFEFEDGVCRKWIVEYNLINWCTNEQRGPYFKKFVHKDVVAPVFTECSAKMFDVDGVCEIKNLTITKTANDGGDCVDNGRIRWQVVVDLWSDGVPDYEWSSFISPADNNFNNDSNGNGIKDIYLAPTINGIAVSISLPEVLYASAANHSITWKAFDGCSNVTTCVESFMVSDKKAPTPVCLPLSTALMADPDGDGPARPMIEIWARDLNFKSNDNCTKDNELLFTFSQVAPQVTNKAVFGQNINKDIPHYFDKTGGLLRFPADMTNAAQRAIVEKYTIGAENTPGNGVIQLWNPAQRSSARVWTDNILPGGTANTTVDVVMSVWDQRFNTDFCITSVRMLCSTCPGVFVADLSGSVKTSFGQGVKNVEVMVNGDLPGFPQTKMTDEYGLYRFGVISGLDYEVSASRNGNYLDGVSTLDLVLIQRHILNIEPFSSPYKIIAADANNNGKVTAADLTELRKLILGITTALPGQESWRFPVVNQPMNAQEPFPFAERILISSMEGDKPHQNFMAVKVGDVNGNAQVGVQDVLVETRTKTALKFTLDDVPVEAGTLIEIPFTSDNFSEIFGWQFTLQLRDAIFAGIKSGVVKVDENNVGILKPDLVTMSYSGVHTQTFADDEILFSLILKVNNKSEISRLLNINSSVTGIESYQGTDFTVGGVELAYRNSGLESSTRPVLYQNEPNPFSRSTTIRYDLPVDMNVKLTMYDVSGKIALVRKISATQGKNTERIDSDVLNGKGVYYYKLENDSFSEIKKMIMIE